MLEIRRPKEDKRVTRPTPFAQASRLSAPNTRIRAIPEVTNVSTRRLVTMLNNFRMFETDEARKCQRYALGRDLRPTSKPKAIKWSDLSSEQQSIIQSVMDQAGASTSQRNGIMHALFNTKHLVAMIQGPPGCGKTRMLAMIVKIISVMKAECLYCGTSNPATQQPMCWLRQLITCIQSSGF